jgi:ribonuclease D
MYIAAQEELENFVQRAQGTGVLALDTEFLREKTYYAKLCLLQIQTDDETAIVDPLAVDDLTPLVPLFEDENIVKIVHSGRQDLEIFKHYLDCVPHPLFDTQIAAALLGHTQQIGYGPLVHSICGVKIRKADSYTDWSRRPLTESQITYASEDVIYLPEMYRKMKQMLEDAGRLNWLDSEFEDLANPDNYVVEPRERYRRLKHSSSLNRRQLAAAREVAAWRELEAQRRNVPRKWVLSDEQIVEACKREPRTIDELFMVRGVRERICTAEARVIVAAIRRAHDSDPSTWPVVDHGGSSERNVDEQVDLMMAIVRQVARENNIAVPTLASHTDLVKLARGHADGLELMRGWRYKMVGAELQELLCGKLALAVIDGEVQIIPRSVDED